MVQPNLNLSPEEQRARLWSALVRHNSSIDDAACPKREWPSYDRVITHVATADYKENIKCPHDFISSKSKTICPHGAVCCAKMELFPFPKGDKGNQPYSGLLTPSTTVENCILRLSSAIRPLDQGIQTPWARSLMKSTVGHKLAKAKIVPGAAIKCFRGNNIPSGNLLVLGSKVGQREEDFFAHCLCTQMTEKMPGVVVPFVRNFWRYSENPLALGLSDFAAYDQHGKSAGGDWNFPFAVVLQPAIDKSTIPGIRTASIKKAREKNFETFDAFIDETTHIPINTPIFDIYAVPDPDAVGDPSKLERIGRVVTTSSVIPSAPTDGISFRHQVKEDDFMIRPEWKDGIKRKIKMDGGKTKGTVGKLAGWRLFEEDIRQGKYIDFEIPTEEAE